MILNPQMTMLVYQNSVQERCCVQIAVWQRGTVLSQCWWCPWAHLHPGTDDRYRAWTEHERMGREWPCAGCACFWIQSNPDEELVWKYETGNVCNPGQKYLGLKCCQSYTRELYYMPFRHRHFCEKCPPSALLFYLNNPNHEGQLVIHIKARLYTATLPLECLNTPEVFVWFCSGDWSVCAALRVSWPGLECKPDLINNYLCSDLTLMLKSVSF